MRALLLLAFLAFLADQANAQVCYGCGCKGGSGWRILTTKTQKCLGCGEVGRCGSPPTERCAFEGCPNIEVIRASCPQYIPAGACLVAAPPTPDGPRPLK